MTETIDHYAVLGISRSAAQQEIAAAYRRLARAHHPDVSHESDAAERMRAINTAYAVLSDPHKRAAYDAARAWPAYVTRQPVKVARAAPRAAPPSPSSDVTRVVGFGFLLLLVGFVAVACVLSSRLPTTAGPDGVPILPRATATASALAALPPQERMTPVASQPKNVSLPGVLRDNPILRTFPRPVLVPPTNLPPFDALMRESPRISGTLCDNDPVCLPRYVIDYGQLTSAGAQISGFGGRDIFESDASAATAACGSPVMTCTAAAISGRPEVWYQRDLRTAAAIPAVARHQGCCPGPYWVLTWYDTASSTTYRLQLSGTAAAFSDADLVDGAARLVSIADGLVPLR